MELQGGRGSTCDSWRGTDVFLFVCVILYSCSNLAESCAGLLRSIAILLFGFCCVCAHRCICDHPRRVKGQAVSDTASRVTVSQRHPEHGAGREQQEIKVKV